MNQVAIRIGAVMAVSDKHKTPELISLILNLAKSCKQLAADQKLQRQDTGSAPQDIANRSNRLSHSDFRDDP